MAQKRLSDKGRQVLRKGEGQRSNGSYYYRWTDQAGERHTIYSKSLTVLREREKELDLDKADGIKYEAMYVTINDVYKLWKDLKRGLKNNTFENYKYMYETFVAPTFGKERVNRIKKSDVKRFYNNLADVRGLKASTIDSVHTVLHSVSANFRSFRHPPAECRTARSGWISGSLPLRIPPAPHVRTGPSVP